MRRPELTNLSISVALAATDHQNTMEHVHEESIQSSPRLSSKYSEIPLDHRSRGEDGMRVRSRLNGYAHHQDIISQDSNSEDEDKQGDEAANNYTSSSNNDDDRGDSDDDNDDDYDVIRNSEGSSENKDDDGGNNDDNGVNCDENCEIEYPNDHESSNNYDDEDNFASNNGVSAKSCTIQSTLYPKEDETFVGSAETNESLTEELNANMRFDSQYSIDEDTGNSSAENNDGSLASSNGISSNNESSCKNYNTRSDKEKDKDLKKTNSFEVGKNAEPSAERDGEATSQGARPKTVQQNPELFNALDTHYQNGKIPSLETTGINPNFLARHSTDTSLPQSSFSESYDMPVSNKNSNDWTQHSLTRNSSSSPFWSLPHSSAPDRSGLMLKNAYSKAVSPRYRDPMPVNYQPVTLMTGQFTGASGFSRGVDSFNWNENLPRKKHPMSFSSFEDFSVGNETQTASPSLGVRPLAPAVRYPVVTTPNFPTTTRQFSSSTTLASVAPVTSTYDVSRSHGQEHVGDFNSYRPSYGDSQENGGLNASEIVHSETREGSSGNHGLFDYQQEDSFALVSPRDPSLVSLEQQVAEIDRILKEREERIKKQREAAQRHRDTRERRQREARERKEREEREMREQEERKRREREQREMREREEREMREREERENRERMERELKERRERETTVRENRTAAESHPLQETPQWQCEHYQRRCSVKFPCCGVFYPCHRCHNLSGTCPADDRKAHHATHVKCGNCGREEEVSIFYMLGILSY